LQINLSSTVSSSENAGFLFMTILVASSVIFILIISFVKYSKVTKSMYGQKGKKLLDQESNTINKVILHNCPACGSKIDKNDMFCQRCGNRI